MTALVVISTLYAGNGILSAGAAEGVSKANMAQLAFGTVLGSRTGSMFVALCLLFFAFSTILSWNFFGRLNVSAAGEKAVGGVFGAGHRVHLSGFVPVQRLGMGAGGSIQPADGAAQRTGAGDAGRTGGSGLPEEVTAAGTGDRPRFSVFCP